MSVFGSVTATLSPALSAYMAAKGKAWKAAFVSSLQTLAGVEYSVYKKKGCWQIKGDWERIKHAHRILNKVTAAPDWPAGGRGGAGRPGRTARGAGRAGAGETGGQAGEGGGLREDDRRTGQEPAATSVLGTSVEIKEEPGDQVASTPTDASTGALASHHLESQAPSTSATPHRAPSERTPVNRRKRGRPRKVEIAAPSPEEDMDTAEPAVGEVGEETAEEVTPKEEQETDQGVDQDFLESDLNSDNDDSAESAGDPVFSIEDMVQEGKANLKVRLKGKSYSCNLCGFTCRSKNGVHEHKKRQHTEKTLKCPKCDKVYGVMRDLRKHIRRHTSQYKCEQCGKTYKEERNYKHHIKTHQDDYVPPQFGCDQCEKSFTTKYVLQTHVDQVHKGNVPEWLCTTCGKKFKQKHSLAEHNLIHTGERPFECKICHKTFRHKGSRVNHELLHSNARHFTCEICGKDFKHRNSLRIHAAIHTSVRNFICSICNKSFTQKQALIRHSRIHSGEKPFMCELCGDRFNDNSILRRHMLGIHKTELKSGKQHFVLPADHYQPPDGLSTAQGGTNKAQEDVMQTLPGPLGVHKGEVMGLTEGESTGGQVSDPAPLLRQTQEDPLLHPLPPHNPPVADYRPGELAGPAPAYTYPIQTAYPTASFQTSDSQSVPYTQPNRAATPSLIPLAAMDQFTPESGDTPKTSQEQYAESHPQPYDRLF